MFVEQVFGPFNTSANTVADYQNITWNSSAHAAFLPSAKTWNFLCYLGAKIADTQLGMSDLLCLTVEQMIC